MKLPENECPDFFQYYADYVEGNILDELEKQLETYVTFINAIPEEKQLFRYREDKWTIKEVVGHNTDTERVKCSAALRLARQDPAEIPGFDEADYVAAAHLNDRSMDSLIGEFKAIRESNIILFKSLSQDELTRMGSVSGKKVSVRAIFYFLVGHVRHHEKILKERYLY